MRYVIRESESFPAGIRDSKADRLAQGGMANAWGAGVSGFNDGLEGFRSPQQISTLYGRVDRPHWVWAKRHATYLAQSLGFRNHCGFPFDAGLTPVERTKLFQSRDHDWLPTARSLTQLTRSASFAYEILSSSGPISGPSTIRS